MHIGRVAVRAPVATVVAWLEARYMAGAVTAGMGELTFVDLALPTDRAEAVWSDVDEEWQVDDLLLDLAVACGGPVVSVMGEGEVAVHQHGRDDSEALPEEVEEILGVDGLAELMDPLARLAPPHGHQVFVVSTPSDANWSIALAVTQAELSIVRLGTWSVVATSTEDLVPLAHGLAAAGSEAGVVISQNGDSWAMVALRRGRPRTGHVRLADSHVVGLHLLSQDEQEELTEPTGDAQELTECIDTAQSRADVVLLRALLRRGPDRRSPGELLALLGVDEAGVLAARVLAGADLREEPDVETSQGSGSPWRDFARLATGGPLEADRVPWISIVYAAWLLLLVPLAVENLADWAGGRLGGWDIAQLVGCAISIPVSVVCLVRVLAWLRVRRS